MQELNILNIYDNSNEHRNDQFIDNIDSKLHVITDFDDAESNYEWLKMMEDTVPYLDNILRNPNRFIVNDEEIVKIELARRVTVESIKHLARNTNLIQDYDKKTGDVKPSKILNINKEESFDTYENKFIYSLIKNMCYFIDHKKKNITPTSGSKDYKTMEYNGTSNLGKEKVNISMTLSSKLKGTSNPGDKGTVQERIEKLELQINDLKSTSVYKNIDKLHITLVTSPIKKTNVILKNVNFQYALSLWNYLQTHFDSNPRIKMKNKNYFDNGNLKKCVDESFLLDYLVLTSAGEKKSEQNSLELSEKLVENLVEKVVNIDSNIDNVKLKELIDKKYCVVKYKTVVNERQIEQKFKKYMDDYLDRIKDLRLQCGDSK